MSIYDEAEKLKEKLKKEQESKLKIALFGQPGSGKSAIINKLVGEEVVPVGVSTDKTVEAVLVEWQDLLLVDLPGYGTSKFPANDYFNEFQIERFDIYLCVFSGKFHDADTQFFRELRNKGKVCLFIRNFHDTIWEAGKSIDELKAEIVEDVEKQVESRETVIFTSCRNGTGLAELSLAIFAHINPAQQAKWAKSAKAYSLNFLEMKEKACQKHVYLASGVAAANGINPIPGADIAVDIGILVGLFSAIRISYGLTDERLKHIEKLMPSVAPFINNIIRYGTKEGLLFLLKTFATREVIKTGAKYVPLVGQAIAATLGFGITCTAGMSYLNDCHKVAKAILEEELSK